MIENVSIIRTILKDCKEKLLVIFYQDEKGSEFVKYDNSNLFLYEKIKRQKIMIIMTNIRLNMNQLVV